MRGNVQKRVTTVLISLLIIIPMNSLFNQDILEREENLGVTEGEYGPLLIQPFLSSQDSISDEDSREWDSISKSKIILRAEETVDLRPEIPQEGGNWTHYFVCDDGNHLTYQANQSEMFWCPSEEVWYSGEKYSSSWISWRHEELVKNALNLAIAYCITQERDYASASQYLLLEYAELYPYLELRNKINGTTGDVGRLTTQSLDEAVMMIDFAWIYDLIRETLNESNRVIIENQLLRGGISTLQYEGNTKKDPRGNGYTWHNAAKMMVGVSIGESDFVDEAIYGSTGFVHQLTHSVLDDGLWYEGSLAYHNYSLYGMLYILEAGRSVGLDLYNFSVTDPDTNQSRTIKQMFLSPIQMLRPDGKFPRMNDDIRGIEIYDMLRIYELANMVWEDSEFDWALQKAIQSGPREDWGSLLWGRVVFPTEYTPESRYYSDSGIGILHTDSSFLMLDFGPHGGWHGHRDKLTFELFSIGEERFIDPGVTFYSLPISSEYFRSTLAHSTVMTDGTDQLEAEGELIQFETFENGGLMSAIVENISSGVTAIRTMIIVDIGSDGAIIFDLIEGYSSSIHEYSTVLHGVGEFYLDGDISKSRVEESQSPPWSYLRNLSRINTSEDLRFSWSTTKDSSVNVIYPIHQNNSSFFFAEAPNNPPADFHSMTMINSSGEKIVKFPTIMHVQKNGSAELVEYQFPVPENNFSYQVTLSDGEGVSIKLSDYEQRNVHHGRGIAVERGVNGDFSTVLDIKAPVESTDGDLNDGNLGEEGGDPQNCPYSSKSDCTTLLENQEIRPITGTDGFITKIIIIFLTLGAGIISLAVFFSGFPLQNSSNGIHSREEDLD